METPYITLTLELGGTDEYAMLELHEGLRHILQAWTHALTYGDLHLAYQDSRQIVQEAHRDPCPGDDEHDAWD